ncbi:divalent cation tolerance protein, putative [Trypanosoma brucei gambiense DAL972]|uniref:Divalent cation tolerance protein, putative n=2 Tax=Trypanosoma brucei TaxID=5691 RepID=C9ZM69_TRYB9|nr:divalent cation tolerance protein, putative [Trypanosoma brucei gambiense DAL972]RHW72809.1 divalent cation tolerance protein [Trypanosoma brucei equiperdum]CBH10742.1 divalent cation tolerance protein, putative [Trypanosoma brucei gambiense DAL972]|eukprot:XP_011773030.1 divalent cation tolerance protein, putative [Trypanosoma brucei gambiense DAL972]
MFSVCYVTTPTSEVAREISRILVSSNKAACVNIVPSVTSVYRWEGQLCEEQECLMMIKTRTELLQEVIDNVKKNHPYSTPEVVSVPISSGSEEYLKWVEENTMPTSSNNNSGRSCR